ncbi:hypothetical protein BN1708_019370, partial [Verticillium longisporum]
YCLRLRVAPPRLAARL